MTSASELNGITYASGKSSKLLPKLSRGQDCLFNTTGQADTMNDSPSSIEARWQVKDRTFPYILLRLTHSDNTPPISSWRRSRMSIPMKSFV